MRRSMIRKIVAIATGMILTVSLAACSSQGSGSTVPEVQRNKESVTSDSVQASTVQPSEAQKEKETESQTEQSAKVDTEVTAENTEQSLPEKGKTLVVYYSASGNTEAVAGYIAAATDADIFVLEPVEPYSRADLNWSDNSSRVVYEHDNLEARNVELVAATVEDWESYDTIFIGYPIWWHIAAWPVDGFIAANDFTGKTVIPFCTSSSSGLGESGKLLAEAAGTGNWLEGERFSSNASEETVRAWVESLDQIKDTTNSAQ